MKSMKKRILCIFAISILILGGYLIVAKNGQSTEIEHTNPICIELKSSNGGLFSNEEKGLWLSSTTTVYRDGTIKYVTKYTDSEKTSAGNITEKEVKKIDKLLHSKDFINFEPEDNGCDMDVYIIDYYFGSEEYYHKFGDSGEIIEYYNQLLDVIQKQ